MQTATPTPTPAPHASPRAPRPPRRALPGSIAAGARDLSVHFEGLANPTRLLIVERLASASEMRVSELADYCQVSQPRMSWHLRILRKADIIRTRREGREVFCRLDRDAIAEHLKSFARLVSFRGLSFSEPSSAQPIREGTS
jgi:DNA-binding transcriptional ArsR family regulator